VFLSSNPWPFLPAVAAAGLEESARHRALLVTISVGVARRGPWATAADLVERADARLYDAKRAGRNRVWV
jgi:PleD family two-component response regulator